MALALPDVTLLTAGANTMTAYMAALRTHFAGTSTKFTVKANGPTDDGFTLVPVAVAENWEVNIRRLNTTDANIAIDPFQGFDAPGNTGATPTRSAGSIAADEWSEEHQSLEIVGGGSESLDFYVIELDDWICVLFMNSGETFTPRATQFGRVLVPWFSDGVNGDNYLDGLGIMGPIPIITNGSGTGYWVSSTTLTSVLRCAQSGGFTAGDPTAAWYNFGPYLAIPGSNVGRIQGVERLRPIVLGVRDTDGSTDNMVGFTKYTMYERNNQPPGTVLDAGVGKDAWVHYNTSTTAQQLVIPWDRNVTPAF